MDHGVLEARILEWFAIPFSSGPHFVRILHYDPSVLGGLTQHGSTHGHHQIVNTEIKLILFFAAKDGEALYSQQKQDWELTGSDHELLIAKLRFKLKKVGKTTRPFRYDPNQIPYDYTVEVRNRFKGVDLIECLMNYGQRFMTLYRRQESRPSPRKRNEKSKMAA